MRDFRHLVEDKDEFLGRRRRRLTWRGLLTVMGLLALSAALTVGIFFSDKFSLGDSSGAAVSPLKEKVADRAPKEEEADLPVRTFDLKIPPAS
ncbi:hypothetical protein [Thiohalomonas denitrificans]|uniref:hypothetical protein n=1 Tax=Thiohalomonas denitrificans TaxID=415747 RepID=UPI0026EBEB1F|nr:hypothetical protein [Thiohalomonas denitrificans]